MHEHPPLPRGRSVSPSATRSRGRLSAASMLVTPLVEGMKRRLRSGSLGRRHSRSSNSNSRSSSAERGGSTSPHSIGSVNKQPVRRRFKKDRSSRQHSSEEHLPTNPLSQTLPQHHQELHPSETIPSMKDVDRILSGSSVPESTVSADAERLGRLKRELEKSRLDRKTLDQVHQLKSSIREMRDSRRRTSLPPQQREHQQRRTPPMSTSSFHRQKRRGSVAAKDEASPTETPRSRSRPPPAVGVRRSNSMVAKNSKTNNNDSNANNSTDIFHQSISGKQLGRLGGLTLDDLELSFVPRDTKINMGSNPIAPIPQHTPNDAAPKGIEYITSVLPTPDISVLQSKVKKAKKALKRACKEITIEKDAVVQLQRGNWSTRKQLYQQTAQLEQESPNVTTANDPTGGNATSSITALTLHMERCLRQERQVTEELEDMYERKYQIEEDCAATKISIEQVQAWLEQLQAQVVPLLPPSPDDETPISLLAQRQKERERIRFENEIARQKEVAEIPIVKPQSMRQSMTHSIATPKPRIQKYKSFDGATSLFSKNITSSSTTTTTTTTPRTISSIPKGQVRRGQQQSRGQHPQQQRTVVESQPSCETAKMNSADHRLNSSGLTAATATPTQTPTATPNSSMRQSLAQNGLLQFCDMDEDDSIDSTVHEEDDESSLESFIGSVVKQGQLVH